MKILQLVQSFLPNLGGMEWVVHHLSNELVRRGHEVIVLAAESPSRRGKEGLEEFKSLYQFQEYPFGRRFGGALGRNRRAILSAIARLRREFKFDLLHAHQLYYPGYCAILDQRKWRYPITITDHGQFYCMQRGLDVPSSAVARRRILWAVQNAPSLTAPGQDAFEELMKHHSAGAPSAASSRVLCNGVAVPDDDAIEMLRQGARAPVPTILMVGRYHRVKGFETGLRALAIMKGRGATAALHIVGGGLDALRPLIAQLRLREDVHLHGPMTGDDLWRRYADATLFWMTSLAEAMGLTKFEALCFGLPCVCNAAAGTRDGIADGDNGLIFKENDAEDLANQTLRLLNDAAMRERIGASARRSAQQYRWEVVVQEYERHYEETLAAHCAQDSLQSL